MRFCLTATNPAEPPAQRIFQEYKAPLAEEPDNTLPVSIENPIRKQQTNGRDGRPIAILPQT